MQENKPVTLPKKRLVTKKEISGDVIFELLKTHTLELAIRAGNQRVIKMLNTSGARFITQIEVVPNPQRASVKIDTIIEVFELLDDKDHHGHNNPVVG
jgi:ABC-type uncharacterized transport system ATPase component